MLFKLIEERRTRIVSSYNNSKAIGWLKFKTGEGRLFKDDYIRRITLRRCITDIRASSYHTLNTKE